MPLTPQQRQQVEDIFTKVASKAFQRLHGLTLSAQPVNPFVAVLVARTPEELAEFIVAQRVERGLVTSLGTQLQKIARSIGTVMHSSGVAGADLEGLDTRFQRHMLMQVKMGPDTVNKDIGDQIAAKLGQAENRIRQGGLPTDWIVMKMLGMCYGRPSHRNRWVMDLQGRGFDVDKIGRDFWGFITGEPDAHLEVFATGLRVAYTYKNSSGKTLAQAIRDGIDRLTAEIDGAWGDGGGGIDWRKVVRDNM